MPLSDGTHEPRHLVRGLRLGEGIEIRTSDQGCETADPLANIRDLRQRIGQTHGIGPAAPRKEGAARLTDHKLNIQEQPAGMGEAKAPEALFAEFGADITAKLEARLAANPEIVRLAGRWFPRALLATVNMGHLNLAEAVLDMAGGGPLPTDDLLKDTETGLNPLHVLGVLSALFRSEIGL